MKHLMTLMALVVAVTAGAQGTTIHEYPWNPDWNNDNYIGSQDLTGFLSAFGSEFGNPPEPCDYDGTPLEELFMAFNWSSHLDSIFIEFEIEDVSTYYVTAVLIQLQIQSFFQISNVQRDFDIGATAYWLTIDGIDNYGAFLMNFKIWFHKAIIFMGCWSLAKLGFLNDGFFGRRLLRRYRLVSHPLPHDWYLDENGIHLSQAGAQAIGHTTPTTSTSFHTGTTPSNG